MKTGANKTATNADNRIITHTEEPAASLKGSPGVCFSECLQAPPALASRAAVKAPEHRDPESKPPKASVPNKNPKASGVRNANNPGTMIPFIAAFVPASAHFA